MAKASLIEAPKDYKTILIRMPTKADTTEASHIRYVMTEGRSKTAIAKEKANLEAEGFFVVVWSTSKALFKSWRASCDRTTNDPGLPDEALEMLRDKFGIAC